MAFFEHLGHDEEQQRISNRKAVAVARKRASDRFGAFLLSSTSEDEFKARLALVEEDLNAALIDVIDEHGGDLDKVKSAVQAGWEDLHRGPDGRWHAPSAAPDDGTDIDTELAEAPSAVGESTGDLISAPESITAKQGRWTLEAAEPPKGAGGAVEREDLPKGDESALGGPSPKIDKGNSGDERGWSLKPIDTETSGTPHPTVEQDVAEKADYRNREFLDQTDAVVTQESLPSDDESAGFTTERNIEQPSQAADQWTGMEGQADPITSESDATLARTADSDDVEAEDAFSEQTTKNTCKGCGKEAYTKNGECADCRADRDSYEKEGALDPDKNPLRDLLEEDFDGFVPQAQVEAAIQQHQGE